MERIATPNLLVLFASLSLWSLAVQATQDHPSLDSVGLSGSFTSEPADAVVGDPAPVLESTPVANAELKGRPLLEDSLIAAASGYWF